MEFLEKDTVGKFWSILFAVTMMPFISGMSGVVYLAAAVLLGAVFLAYAWKIYRDYSDDLARKTFRYSIVYLSLLFAALFICAGIGVLVYVLLWIFVPRK